MAGFMENRYDIRYCVLMPLVEDIVTGRFSIQAYELGQITINEKIYAESLVLSAEQIISPWPVNSLAQLQHEHLQCIFELQPEVVLLGTGEKQIFPDISIMGQFAQKGAGLEVMDTGALCRTFNILVAEDRRVVAAVIQSAV